MSERKLTGLECKKVEQTDTETDKGASTKYTYQFQDEDKNYVVTLKTTEQMDYTVGQDIGVIIEKSQKTIQEFEENIDPETGAPPKEECVQCGGECGIESVIHQDIDGTFCSEICLNIYEAQNKPEPDTKEPPMYPEPEETEEELASDEAEKPMEEPKGEVFENPGCVDYTDGDQGNPGLCACSGRTNPYCEGEGCIDIRPTEEPPKASKEAMDILTENDEEEVVVPKDFKVELQEGTIAMDVLKNIDSGASDEVLLATFMKTYNNFGSEEYEAVLSWLEEQEYITFAEVDCKQPILTDKGRDRLVLVNMPPEEKEDGNTLYDEILRNRCAFWSPEDGELGECCSTQRNDPNCIGPTCSEFAEEKGSPETPSKEKEEPEPQQAIFVNDTTVRGVAKDRWECPGCNERWNRSLDKRDTTTKCKNCGIYLRLGNPTLPGPETETNIDSNTDSNVDSNLKVNTDSKQESIPESKPESKPLEETLDALTNGDGPPPEKRAEEPERKMHNRPQKLEVEPYESNITEQEAAEEKAKTEAFEKGLEETATGEEAGEPSTLLCKKTNFPTNLLGGLAKDVVIEKNMKENFLYAHAQSIQAPINGVQIQKFCHALKLKTGADWKHVTDKTFKADQDQLNRARGEPELIE
jgi:hypothetical protein